MSQEDSDDFKAVIRSKLYDFYGGEKEFDLVAKNNFGRYFCKKQKTCIKTWL